MLWQGRSLGPIQLDRFSSPSTSHPRLPLRRPQRRRPTQRAHPPPEQGEKHPVNSRHLKGKRI